jgi:hypothetical protein
VVRDDPLRIDERRLRDVDPDHCYCSSVQENVGAKACSAGNVEHDAAVNEATGEVISAPVITP